MKKELLERKIGGKKSKIGSALAINYQYILYQVGGDDIDYLCCFHYTSHKIFLHTSYQIAGNC